MPGSPLALIKGYFILKGFWMRFIPLNTHKNTFSTFQNNSSKIRLLFNNTWLNNKSQFHFLSVSQYYSFIYIHKLHLSFCIFCLSMSLSFCLSLILGFFMFFSGFLSQGRRLKQVADRSVTFWAPYGKTVFLRTFEEEDMFFTSLFDMHIKRSRIV